MAETFFDRIHKTDSHSPDVLSCLANLSNDEVFTPPDVAAQVIDMLPQELFESTETTFLDPACKTGVFLREIAKRLLKAQMPDYLEKVSLINAKKRLGETTSEADEAYLERLHQKVDHIFHNQLYGIAITELTSLLSRRSVYCSMFPNGKYSVSKFESAEGNIRFRRINHTWKGPMTYDKNGNPNRKCAFCGASEAQWKRGDLLETHAYEFIHKINIEEALNMSFFDVIISNPPYHLQTQEKSKQAKPLYNLFVDKAKSLKPRYMTMIIPSKWFSGGFGLDSFRAEMLADKHIRKIVDYPNSHEVFTGVDVPGGVCYFLWDRDNAGSCEITNVIDGKTSKSVRELDEYPVFVRFSQAIPIIRKVFEYEKPRRTMEETVSSAKPFGLSTNYEPREHGIPCWFIQKIGKKFADPQDVVDTNNLLNKWKFLVPRSPIAGQTDFNKPVGFYYDGNTRIAEPGECCTESYLVAGAFDTKEELLHFKSYLFTKTVRFLLLQAVVSQDVLRNKYCFVPALESYDEYYTDELLKERWHITDTEWEYIDSRIHNYDGENSRAAKED